MARNILVLLVVGTVICFVCSAPSADVPHMINYQGKLTTASGGCLNDTVQMSFTIYSDSLGTVNEWSETQTEVIIKDGIFNVFLGSVDNIPSDVFDGSVKYLGVQVESDPEMRPLKPMVSVAYAYRSIESDTADFALSGAPDDDWDIDTAGVNVYRLTGDVGIGTPSPQYKLDIRGTTGIDVGTNFGDIPLTINVPSDQSALISRIAKGGSVINVVDADGNVGIGTFSPQEKLDVSGTARVTGFKMPTGASDGFVLTSDGSGDGTWQPGGGGPNPGWVDDGSIVRLEDSTDYVCIGTKNNPGYSKLFLSHDYHQLTLQENDAATDEKNWCIDADNGDFAIWAVDDAFGGWTSVMYVDRVGTAPERVIFQGKFGMGDSYPDARLEVSAEGGADDLLMLSSNDDNDGDRFVVKNGGSVGIGSADPQYKLDIRGTTGIDVGSYSGDIPLTINVPSDQSALISRIAKGGSVINVVDADGNVGIGTFSPQEKLDVAGITRTTGFEMPTGASNGYVLTSDVSGVGTWQPGGGGGGGWTDDGTVVRLQTGSDSVGIGTSNPGAPLQVGSGSHAPVLVNTSVQVDHDDASEHNIEIRNNSGATGWRINSTGSTTFGPLSAGQDLYLLGGNSTRMTIDGTSGNVGIGITSPDARLHIVPSGTRALTIQRDDEIHLSIKAYGNLAYPILQSVRGRGTGASPSAVQSGDPLFVFQANGQYVPSANRTGGQLLFEANQNWGASACGTRILFKGVSDNSSSVSEWMRLVNGKVGVGTTSPQGALDVSSTTGAFIVPRMTTAQRDALTAVNGMIIYNTSTNQFNFYENGAWVTK
jgi:hypothetical protein